MVEYACDAWGKPLSQTGALAATLGTLNPFCYRGCVFDEETGLYSLGSRYYHPAWGRFLNADRLLGNTIGLLNHNIYAYCGNNPVKRMDKSGLHHTTIVAGEDLFDLINAQEGVENMPYVSQLIDKLYELMQYSETSGITYDNNGASNKKFLQ